MITKLKKSSLEIIRALESGASQRSLIKRGFPESTVRYYHLKINRPKAFEKRIKNQVKHRRNAKLDKNPKKTSIKK